MLNDFDMLIDRRSSDSAKWGYYDPDVLPLWVADMDFRSPEPVIQALRERVEHGVFGYAVEPAGLRDVLVARLHTLYSWQVTPDALVLIPGVVVGFNLVCQAFASPGQGVLVQPPVYPPILHAYSDARLTNNEAELARDASGRYAVDLAAFEAAITGQTRLFILCNPHNPVGRTFGRAELEGMAAACLRHNVLICSDEIHCDIVYQGHRHIPIASIAPEVEQQTITLMAPSKTFNIPGLRFAMAVIPNPELRERFVAVQGTLAGPPSLLSIVAALAAYRDGQPWLDQALAYLQANRDFLLAYLRAHLPAIHMSSPEATYLAWLDCRQAGMTGTSPYGFFLKKAKVALGDGASFGRCGTGFVRLNFGCPRSILAEALEKMKQALA